MDYIYAAAILHERDQEINEQNMKAILEAAGGKVSESRIKALIAALEDVDIEQAISAADPMPSGDSAPAVQGGDATRDASEVEAADEELPDTAEDAEVEADEDDDDLGDLFG